MAIPTISLELTICGKITHADKLIIANAGHGANVEQPEVFNAAMAKFIKAL